MNLRVFSQNLWFDPLPYNYAKKSNKQTLQTSQYRYSELKAGFLTLFEDNNKGRIKNTQTHTDREYYVMVLFISVR